MTSNDKRRGVERVSFLYFFVYDGFVCCCVGGEGALTALITTCTAVLLVVSSSCPLMKEKTERERKGEERESNLTKKFFYGSQCKINS